MSKENDIAVVVVKRFEMGRDSFEDRMWADLLGISVVVDAIGVASIIVTDGLVRTTTKTIA